MPRLAMIPLPALVQASTGRSRRAWWRAAGCALLAPVLLACGGGGGGGSGGSGNVNVVTEAPTMAPAAWLEGAPGETRSVEFVVDFSQNLTLATILSYQSFELRSALGYATEGNSCAVAGVDYLRSAGDVKIFPETRRISIPVLLCGDAQFEPNEKFGMRLTWNGFTVNAVGTIINDDPGGLNDTGVKSCGNGLSNGACPQPGYAGQDGELGRDAQAPTQSGAALLGFAYDKLDAGGALLASGSANWVCIRDRVTGLVWDSASGGAGPTANTWSVAKTYVAALNTASRCGFSDWRLPELGELLSLVDLSRGSGPLVDATLFPSQRAETYWSGSAFAGDASAAWVVGFAFGSGASSYLNTGRSDISYRGVRGQTDAQRLANNVCDAAAVGDPYLDNLDGTITDPLTGLMWMQCSEGQSGNGCASGAPLALGWQQALARAATVNASAATLGRSYGDWRLPNRNELASLVKPQCLNPSINRRRFPNTPADSYWSSSPWGPDPGRIWYVNFVEGNLAPGVATDAKPLRLVRGGQ